MKKIFVKESSIFYSDEYWKNGATNIETDLLENKAMLVFDFDKLWVREWAFNGFFGKNYEVDFKGRNIDTKGLDFCYYNAYLVVGLYLTDLSIHLIMFDRNKPLKLEKRKYMNQYVIEGKELCYLIPQKIVSDILELKRNLKLAHE